MNKKIVVLKLKDFKLEIENCQSIDEFKRIEERLKRILKEVYPVEDPFIKRCHSSWGISPSTLRSLENALY